MKNLVIGTAGHIDHGKSSLVEALTGTHPDRLQEEQRRGITIDLGFAFLNTPELRLGFVDVPGHERFVRNMLAGAGGIDCVLLTVAADEGIKPQTREHFEICKLLGISRGVVALTKSDLADRDVLALVRLELEDYLRGSFLEGAPIVAVSARTGEGLPALKETIFRVAREAASRDSQGWFRLPIDRAFAVKGFGTVVTGTLVSGSIRPEEEVELLPARRRLRVRGIHSAGAAVAEAAAGQRTALNLVGIEVGDLKRGMTLAAPGHFQATKRADARLVLVDSAKRPLKNRAKVHFHQNTSETPAEVVLLGSRELPPGASAWAQLIFQDEVFLLPGDRFILRQFSPVITIGGGMVLDALPRRHSASDRRALPLLGVLEKGLQKGSDRGAEASADGEVLAALLEDCGRSQSLAELVARTGWTERAIAEAAPPHTASRLRVLTRQPLRLAAARHVEETTARIRQYLGQFYARNPLAEGIPKEALRAAVKADPHMVRVALEQLVLEGELSISADTVKRAGRAVALNASQSQDCERIAEAFEKAAFRPPAWDQVLEQARVSPAHARELLQLLLRERVLVRVSEDVILHAAALARLRGMLGDYKRNMGPRISVPAFKDLAGVTRKHAIPILEYLDRTGVTKRQGDERVIL
jgi:selenocysteine-specific elongation factor